MYTVYQFIFPNGKQYIGQTSRPPAERWKEGTGYKTQVVGKAIDKYGWENIQKNILATMLTSEQADNLEKYYIKLYNTLIEGNGYNISAGGKGYTKQWDKQTVYKLWQQHLTVKEIAEQMQYSYYQVNQILKEKGITTEMKRMRSEENIEYKQVSVFAPSGDLVDICVSIKEAADKYKINSNLIKNNCEYKSLTAGGLRFRYYTSWRKAIEPLPDAEKKLKQLQHKYKEKGINLKKFW